MSKLSHTFKIFAFALVMLLSQAGCTQQEPVMLSLVSYNYTGRYIDRYTVNGASGGNAYEDTAGGRIVCCILLDPRKKMPFTVKVEWLLADKRDFEKNTWVPAPDEKRSATATVYGPLPAKPYALETHFLPDGSVRVFVTSDYTEPYFTPEGKPLRPLPGLTSSTS